MLKIVNNFQGTFRYYTNTHLNCLIQEEYLFTNPGENMFHDENNTKYYIGHNGCGRYVPGTLEIIDNQTGLKLERDTDYTENSNGISFNFTSPLDTSKIHKDYIIKYLVRPEDFAFSNNILADGPFKKNIRKQLSKHCSDYKIEEYFLFPNWMEAPGCGDGFWVGKYKVSKENATEDYSGADDNIYVYSVESKPLVHIWNGMTFNQAKKACKLKGNNFHLMRNREWMNIAYWCLHHKIDHIIEGYYSTPQTPEPIIIGELDFDITWRHNLQSSGIANMVGGYWEYIDGIAIDWKGSDTGSSIYLFDYTQDADDELTPKIDSSVNPLNVEDFIESPTSGGISNYNSSTQKYDKWNIYFEDNNYKYEGIHTNKSNLNTVSYNTRLIDSASTGQLFEFANNVTSSIINKGSFPYAVRAGASTEKFEVGLFYLELWKSLSTEAYAGNVSFRICRDLV